MPSPPVVSSTGGTKGRNDKIIQKIACSLLLILLISVVTTIMAIVTLEQEGHLRPVGITIHDFKSNFSSNLQQQKHAAVPKPLKYSLMLSAVSTSSSVLVCQTSQPYRPRKHISIKTHEYKINYKSLELEHEVARKESFDKIYRDFAWGGGELINGELFGGSGPGSLLSSTKEVMKTLDVVIDTVKAALGKTHIRMLDIPCGDLVWMRHYLGNRTDVDYTGMDIVDHLITHHSTNYPHWTFKQHDIVKDPIAGEKYDLIFSRQMTQHLGTEDTMRVLQHFSDGGRYLLITNYPDVLINTPLDARTKYRFRQQNLEIEPFSLTDPICEDVEQGCVNSFYKLPLQQWD